MSVLPIADYRKRCAGARAQSRGRSWETTVEVLLTLLARRGLCTWWRTPEPLKRIEHVKEGRWICVPIGKGPPDYVVLARGVPIALEAKHTELDRWSFSDLQTHQAEALDAWVAQGGRSIIALDLDGEAWALDWRRLAVRWWKWSEGKATRGGASLSAEDCKELGVELDAEGRWLG